MYWTWYLEGGAGGCTGSGTWAGGVGGGSCCTGSAFCTVSYSCCAGEAGGAACTARGFVHCWQFWCRWSFICYSCLSMFTDLVPVMLITICLEKIFFSLC